MSQDQPKLLAKKKSRRTTLEAIPRGWNQRRTIEVEARPHWVTFLPRWVLYLFGHPVTPKKKRFLNPQLFCKKKSQKKKPDVFGWKLFGGCVFSGSILIITLGLFTVITLLLFFVLVKLAGGSDGSFGRPLEDFFSFAEELGFPDKHQHSCNQGPSIFFLTSDKL